MDIHSILDSEWFKEPSPFRAIITRSNPKVFVVTGANASGKSLFRKLLYNEYLDNKVELIHTSQAGRCRSGLARMFIYGTEEDQSTGFNSVKTLLKVINNIKLEQTPIGVLLDEPEIGCSEELQAGLGFRLVTEYNNIVNNLDALFIVSHSRNLIDQVRALHPSHIYLGHPNEWQSLSDWCNRKIMPLQDLEGLVDLGHERWRAVQDMINERKKNASH